MNVLVHFDKWKIGKAKKKKEDSDPLALAIEAVLATGFKPKRRQWLLDRFLILRGDADDAQVSAIKAVPHVMTVRRADRA